MEEKQRDAPVVHYAFGTPGSALFTGPDLIAVPVLNLAPAPTEQPGPTQKVVPSSSFTLR
jgi:hypothetical protein